MTYPMCRPRRRKPRPDVQEAALHEAQRSAVAWKAAYDALLASIPARDQEVARAAVRSSAPGIAQAAVDALHAQGYIRQKPTESVVVKHVVRDAEGRITGMIERPGTIEPTEDHDDAA